MKKAQLLKLIIALGVVVMLAAFIVLPDDYPMYYEILLFNLGFWLFFFSRKALKNIPSSLSTNQ